MGIAQLPGNPRAESEYDLEQSVVLGLKIKALLE